MAFVKDSCTPFNSKTCKYSQPSFKMELLRSFVLTNKNVVQWSVTNHMKEPNMLCPFSKCQNMFEKINITMTKYEEVMLVLLAFMFWQFDPPLFILW
jgi:hypothetical protein